MIAKKELQDIYKEHMGKVDEEQRKIKMEEEVVISSPCPTEFIDE